MKLDFMKLSSKKLKKPILVGAIGILILLVAAFVVSISQYKFIFGSTEENPTEKIPTSFAVDNLSLNELSEEHKANLERCEGEYYDGIWGCHAQPYTGPPIPNSTEEWKIEWKIKPIPFQEKDEAK